MQTPITPFLLAHTSNEGILQKADQKLKFLRIQKMSLSQKISLKSLIRQIRSYQTYTHMIIDTSVVEEESDSFIEALETIQMLCDGMRIIIYATEMKDGGDFFDTLVNKGFTNIVAVSDKSLDEAAKWEQIQSDILECFSENGLSQKRWKLYQKADLAALRAEKEKERLKEEAKRKIPDFSEIKTKICFFGTNGRVGTTAAALVSASYFAAGKADVKVILRSSEEILVLKKYLRAAESHEEKTFTYNENVVFTSSAESDENESFNAIIYDMGKLGGKPLQSGALNVITADVGFDALEFTLGKLNNAALAEDEPFKVLINLCSNEKWNKLTKNGLIDKNLYDYEKNPPLILPFAEDMMNFEMSEENILRFNEFFANVDKGIDIF